MINNRAIVQDFFTSKGQISVGMWLILDATKGFMELYKSTSVQWIFKWISMQFENSSTQQSMSWKN